MVISTFNREQLIAEEKIICGQTLKNLLAIRKYLTKHKRWKADNLNSVIEESS